MVVVYLISKKYRKKVEQIKVDENNYSDNQMKEVYAKQKSKLDELHMFVGLMFIKYATDGYLKISNTVKNNLISQVDNKLSEIGKDLGSTEVKKVSSILGNVFSNTYSKNAEAMGTNAPELTQALIDAAINTEFKGELFSDRIWKNKSAMVDQLKKSLVDSMQGTTTIDKVGKDIQKTFNVQAYESQRLMRTESSRIQAQASIELAHNEGLKEHMWSATLEAGTCTECADLDGQIFLIDDETYQIPLHPNCNCVWVNLLNGDNGENNSEENDTGDENNDIIDYIKSEQQPKNIEKGQQQKHIVGTNEYKQYQEKFAKKGQYGPSRLNISEAEAQNLIDKYHGTGKIKMSNGIWDNKEVILSNDKVIGTVVNNKTGQEAETTVFKIHYGKKGAHIVPDYPSKKR